MFAQNDPSYTPSQSTATQEPPQMMDQVAVEIMLKRFGVIGKPVGGRKHAEVFTVVHDAKKL